MKSIRIQNYDVIHRPSSSNKAIIILHGYGADYTDLAPFGEYLDPESRLNWYFINGPEQIQFGGRAWYHLDVARFQLSAADGSYEKWIENTKQDGAIEASKKLLPVIREIKANYEDLSIGGFSQGSMISGEVAFAHPELFSKLVIMSGTFFGQEHWDNLTKDKKVNFKIFQDHGKSDPVLPFNSALKLKSYFEDKGYLSEFHDFSGGHEIPPQILNKLKTFLGL